MLVHIGIQIDVIYISVSNISDYWWNYQKNDRSDKMVCDVAYRIFNAKQWFGAPFTNL